MVGGEWSANLSTLVTTQQPLPRRRDEVASVLAEAYQGHLIIPLRAISIFMVRRNRGSTPSGIWKVSKNMGEEK